MCGVIGVWCQAAQDPVFGALAEAERQLQQLISEGGGQQSAANLEAELGSSRQQATQSEQQAAQAEQLLQEEESRHRLTSVNSYSQLIENSHSTKKPTQHVKLSSRFD